MISSLDLSKIAGVNNNQMRVDLFRRDETFIPKASTDIRSQNKWQENHWEQAAITSNYQSAGFYFVPKSKTTHLIEYVYM